MGKFCTSCGSQLLPNSLFCGECGAKNEHNVAPAAPKASYAPPRTTPAPVARPPPRYQPQYETYEDPNKAQDDSTYNGTSNYNQGYNYNYSQDDTNYGTYGFQQPARPPPAREPPARSQPASSGGWAPPPAPARTVPPPPSQPRTPQPGSSPSNGTLWTANKSKAPSAPAEKPTGAFTAPANAKPTPEDEEKKKADEKKKAEERRAREKEMQKREEEYTRNRESSKQIEQFKEKQKRTSFIAKSMDPASCYCEMHVVQWEVKKKANGKPDFVAFKVDVIFGESEWAIWRRWKQFNEIDGVFKSNVRGYQPCLPNIDKNQYGSKFDPQLCESRKNGLETYMAIIANARPAIFESKVAAAKFFQFIAPVQYGDYKPLGFIMPFKVIPC